jgi:hypothetical protein
MAVLNEADRAEMRRNWAEANRESVGITKPELRAAIDAADDWANSNATSYNSALPLPARTSLTAAQKARILAYVVTRRFERS